jgi:ribonuclease HI
MGPGLQRGPRWGVYGQSVNRRLSISLGKHATVFQAEVYAKLACVHETETQDRPEKYVSICSDSQATLKVLQAAKTSPLVRQCQQALNDISTWHAVGLYWVPGHAGVRGNEITDRHARSGSAQQFVGPEPFMGHSREAIRRKMKRWMEKQHLVLWGGPCSTQRRLNFASVHTVVFKYHFVLQIIKHNTLPRLFNIKLTARHVSVS